MSLKIAIGPHLRLFAFISALFFLLSFPRLSFAEPPELSASLRDFYEKWVTARDRASQFKTSIPQSIDQLRYELTGIQTPSVSQLVSSLVETEAIWLNEFLYDYFRSRVGHGGIFIPAKQWSFEELELLGKFVSRVKDPLRQKVARSVFSISPHAWINNLFKSLFLSGFLVQATFYLWPNESAELLNQNPMFLWPTNVVRGVFFITSFMAFAYSAKTFHVVTSTQTEKHRSRSLEKRIQAGLTIRDRNKRIALIERAEESPDLTNRMLSRCTGWIRGFR